MGTNKSWIIGDIVKKIENKYCLQATKKVFLIFTIFFKLFFDLR